MCLCFNLSPGTAELLVLNEKVCLWTLQADHVAGWGGSGFWGEVEEIHENLVENKEEEFHAVNWAPTHGNLKAPNQISLAKAPTDHTSLSFTLFLTAAWGSEPSSFAWLLLRTHNQNSWTKCPLEARAVMEFSPASCNVQACLHYKEPNFINGIKFILMLQEKLLAC